MLDKDSILKIINTLSEAYPEAKCSLDFKNDLQLLVATELAAQCTDERVNQVTKNLFKKYKNVQDFSNADIIQLENDIKPTGFYRNKAKNIKNACKIIIENFNGKVPSTMDELLTLPGVGRKTANVMLGVIHNIPSIIIDTHAKRLSKRIGLTENEDPFKIELDLMKIIPKKYWTEFCHYMVFHGRKVCNARKPACSTCKINNYCRYFKVSNQSKGV